MIINHLLWGDVFYEFNAVRFCSIDKPIQFRTLETAIRNFALGSGTVNKDHATIRMSSFNTTGVDIKLIKNQFFHGRYLQNLDVLEVM